MSLKRFLGEILTDLGFVTKDQLQGALARQRTRLQSEDLPERVQRDKLVAEARMAVRAETASLLGQILTDMGLVTREQLNVALATQQEELNQIYRELDTEKLGTAVEIGYAVNSTLSIADVLSLIMKNVNRVTDSEAASLMLLDERTGELVFSVPTGAGAEKLTDVRVPPGEGIAGWVAQNGQPVLVRDAREDPRFYPQIDVLSGLETRSILCVPLRTKGKTIGVLEAINKSDGTSFTDEDLRLMSVFSSQAAVAIENARLYGELKDRLQEEKQLKRELMRTEKLRALGQMASGIAHDFNNILAAILGYAELAVYDLSEEHIARHSIDQIVRAGYRAKDLVKQILAFTRKSEEKRIPLNLRAVVEEAIGLIRASVPSTIEIRQELESAPETVLADATQVHQVLMNLCANASHAMRENGGTLEVTLQSAVVSSGEAVFCPDLRPGSYVRLSVVDTGHGMDQATIDRIFDPYFTTKEKGVGTGMGLAVTLGIVRSHGGAIAVVSDPGKGSTFHVYFPSTEDATDEPVQNGGSELSRGTGRILFVDDEKHLATLGKQMLERLGYTVHMSTCPLEALDEFRSSASSYDLVVSDVTMPKMTGDELAQRIKELNPRTPVILCTGFTERISERDAETLGVTALLAKPLMMGELAAAVRRTIESDKQ